MEASPHRTHRSARPETRNLAALPSDDWTIQCVKSTWIAFSLVMHKSRLARPFSADKASSCNCTHFAARAPSYTCSALPLPGKKKKSFTMRVPGSVSSRLEERRGFFFLQAFQFQMRLILHTTTGKRMNLCTLIEADALPMLVSWRAGTAANLLSIETGRALPNSPAGSAQLAG